MWTAAVPATQRAVSAVSASSLLRTRSGAFALSQGFGTHGHRDMEIVTCVLEGALAHEDSLGNGSVLRPGEFQRMTAGSMMQDVWPCGISKAAPRT